MLDLERIYKEMRFYQVVIVEPGGPKFLPDEVGELLGDRRLMRGRMTQKQAQLFLEKATQVPGQQDAVVRSIFE